MIEIEDRHIPAALAMRHREPPKNSKEKIEAADEICRRIAVVEGWYTPWINKWTMLQSMRPKLAESVMAAKDSIDTVYGEWLKSETTWEKVEAAIDDYGAAWGQLVKAVRTVI